MAGQAMLPFPEAREIVRRHIFGDDLIDLSLEEQVLIREHGPRPRPSSAMGDPGLIGKCPPKLADKLDLALGRRERFKAQVGTATDWLEARGFVYTPAIQEFRKDALDAALAADV